MFQIAEVKELTVSVQRYIRIVQKPSFAVLLMTLHSSYRRRVVKMWKQLAVQSPEGMPTLRLLLTMLHNVQSYAFSEGVHRRGI